MLSERKLSSQASLPSQPSKLFSSWAVTGARHVTAPAKVANADPDVGSTVGPLATRTVIAPFVSVGQQELRFPHQLRDGGLLLHWLARSGAVRGLALRAHPPGTARPVFALLLFGTQQMTVWATPLCRKSVLPCAGGRATRVRMPLTARSPFGSSRALAVVCPRQISDSGGLWQFLCLCCGYICWVLTEPVDPDQTRLKTAKAT